MARLMIEITIRLYVCITVAYGARMAVNINYANTRSFVLDGDVSKSQYQFYITPPLYG